MDEEQQAAAIKMQAIKRGKCVPRHDHTRPNPPPLFLCFACQCKLCRPPAFSRSLALCSVAHAPGQQSESHMIYDCSTAASLAVIFSSRGRSQGLTRRGEGAERGTAGCGAKAAGDQAWEVRAPRPHPKSPPLAVVRVHASPAIARHCTPLLSAFLSWFLAHCSAQYHTCLGPGHM